MVRPTKASPTGRLTQGRPNFQGVPGTPQEALERKQAGTPEKDVDSARDFVARIQAKDEAHLREVHDGWVVSPEPQFVHLGCSKAEPDTKTVVIRKCPCAVALARDGKEPYCIACKLIVHTLNMGS